MLSSEWREVKLRDVINIEMGQSPKSEFYNSDGNGLPFLQGNRTFGEKYPTIDTYCTDTKKIANPGEVIMSVRAPVGDLNIVQEKICIGRGVCAMNLKNGNNMYLYYLLKHNMKILLSRESGTVFGSVNKNDINGLEVLYTSNEKEQKAIADTLACLDDMIEVNNRTNRVLEEMAQAIFKQWFVDFEFPNKDGEPYKSSGGEMVDSELGEIPKGWRAFGLGDIGKFIKGKKPKDLLSARTNKNQEQYLTIDALNSGNPQFADRDKMIIADEYDILMVMDGASSGTVYFGMNGIIGSTISKFDVSNRKLREMVYQFLKVNEWEIKTHNTGSAIPHTDKSYVLRSQITVPRDNDLNTVSAAFELIRGTIINSRKQNQTLTTIRDNLLPKLMSGEIRVPIKEVV